MKSLLLNFAERLMRCPAAPYFEGNVRAMAVSICLEQELECSRDSYGNILVSYRGGGKGRPLALAAHLDHPGFEIVKQLGSKRLLAKFRGGVGDAYFKAGMPLRLLPHHGKAKLGARVGKEKSFELETSKSIEEQPQFAVWEMEDFAVKKGVIHGRACDDLIGCAAILATMAQLKKQRAKTNVIGILARSEEVGFHGALMVAEKKLLPDDALVVSLETSREMSPVKMGQGVIVRVGDRSSIFDSNATRFLSEIGTELTKKQKGFQFQRALMSGGTCEGTAYQEYGYQTAALCVALGNYHNCGPRDRIAAEYVSLADAEGMVDLLLAAAKRMKDFDALAGKLPKRLKALAKEARGEFRRLG
ncbi:MAG TPA: M20/M25/M40 family metallo-hydrolase [Verrucomicrobiae bacterium]